MIIGPDPDNPDSAIPDPDRPEDPDVEPKEIFKQAKESSLLANEALLELEKKNKHLTEFLHEDGKTSENKSKESNSFSFNLCNKCLSNNNVVKKVPNDEKELEVELEEI